MPIDGVRVTGGTMTMFDEELFAVLAPLFVTALVAIQLFVPELILDPSATPERVVEAVIAEGVTLGAVTRGVEGLLVFAAGVEKEDVETEGIRTMPVLD